jgi:hypothetical protein
MVNRFLVVSLRPVINFRLFGYFRAVSATPGKNLDTAKKLFAGVSDNGILWGPGDND